MSSFPEEIQAAFSQVKQQHPGWGASVAQARIAERRDVSAPDLLSISTIEKFWAEKHPELLRSHRPQRPAPDPDPIPDISEPHERW